VTPGFFSGSLLSGSHSVLDFGEDLLDWIEVGRVGRQVPESCASGLDHLPDGGRLVGAEIVHNYDVAGLERADELLFDIGAEALAVDRPIEDARSGKPVTAQRAQKGQRAPVTVRSKGAQPFASLPPAAQRRHVGLDPGLVDRRGSRPACDERHRWRRRATSERACSRANSVFF
jgi:hypothetical protein